MVKFNNFSSNFNKKGFTLIESIVGIAIFGIVFVGIFGAYRLGIKAVGLSKNKITAMAIANSQIESIRNLAYDQVGTQEAVLPEASGILEPAVNQTLAGAVYTVETKVKYISDPADGIGIGDDCNLDYKKVDITVSWEGAFSGDIVLSTSVAPESLTQELQSCMSQPGGVLEVKIFDDAGIAVPSPTITVRDPATGNVIDSAMPADGIYAFPLTVGTYRVEAAKNDYSFARTYPVSEVAVPDSPDPSVINGSLTPASLSIDRAATFSIDGVSPTGQDSFADAFADQSLISELNGAQISFGSAILAGPPYASGGNVVSVAIAPADFVAWNSFAFNDDTPVATDAVYQLLYYDGVDWLPVPDLDLGGNSSGFSNSPIDLSGIDKNNYPQLKIKGILSSSDVDVTPSIGSWQLFWSTSAGLSVPEATFHIKGAKVIGRDEYGQEVHKYDQDLTLDGSGRANLLGIDADAYVFSADPLNGLDLIGTDCDPQPVYAGGGQNIAVKIFLRAQNSFLVAVQEDLSLSPVFSSAVRVYAPLLGYDKTQYTDAAGQTYFAPLENGNYTMEIVAAGYDNYAESILIAGQTSLTAGIHRQD